MFFNSRKCLFVFKPVKQFLYKFQSYKNAHIQHHAAHVHTRCTWAHRWQQDLAVTNTADPSFAQFPKTSSLPCPLLRRNFSLSFVFQRMPLRTQRRWAQKIYPQRHRESVQVPPRGFWRHACLLAEIQSDHYFNFFFFLVQNSPVPSILIGLLE